MEAGAPLVWVKWQRQQGRETASGNGTVTLVHTDTRGRGGRAWRYVHSHTNLRLWWTKARSSNRSRALQQTLSSIHVSTLSEQKPGQPVRGPALHAGWKLGSMTLPSRRSERQSKDPHSTEHDRKGEESKKIRSTSKEDSNTACQRI